MLLTSSSPQALHTCRAHIALHFMRMGTLVHLQGPLKSDSGRGQRGSQRLKEMNDFTWPTYLQGHTGISQNSSVQDCWSQNFYGCCVQGTARRM